MYNAISNWLAGFFFGGCSRDSVLASASLANFSSAAAIG